MTIIFLTLASWSLSDTYCVLCEVGIKFIHTRIIYMDQIPEVLAVMQAVIRRPDHWRSRSAQCVSDSWWAEWNCHRSFSECLIFSCQYHSANAAYSFSSSNLPLKKMTDGRTLRTGYNIGVVLEIGSNVKEKVLPLFLCLGGFLA